MKASSRNTLVLATAANGRGGSADRAPRASYLAGQCRRPQNTGIRGKVRRMQINFLAPGVTLSGVSKATLYTPGHRIEVGVIALNSQRKDLLRARFTWRRESTPRESRPNFSSTRMTRSSTRIGLPPGSPS